MVVPATEHRLQMRILFLLTLLGTLVALAFGQSAGLFNPPSIVAAGAQTPLDLTQPGSPETPGGGFVPGTRQPVAGLGRSAPRGPGAVAARPGAPADDGIGGPTEFADATGALPPTIAESLGSSQPATTPTGDDLGTGGVPPTTGGNGGTGGAPGAAVDPTDPGTGNPDPGTPGNPDPGTPVDPGPPTTAVPEPATWMILIVGIAIVGGALRRRRPIPVRTSVAHA